MKNRFFIVLLAGILLLGLGNEAMADDAFKDVIVSVAAIDALEVGADAITFNLDTVDALGNITDPDCATNTTTLSYTHNMAATRKITAVAAQTVGGANTISLFVEVTGGGVDEITLVSGGMAQAVQDVYTNIPAGTVQDAPVTFDAAATAAGTAPDSYTFQVTFTSTDA